MKANLKFLKENERGDTGVGTLIKFTAMAPVAAIAANVFIHTLGSNNSFGVRRYFRLIT